MIVAPNIRLSRAAICAEPDCHQVFEMAGGAGQTCPKCGSGTWTSLQRWLDAEPTKKSA